MAGGKGGEGGRGLGPSNTLTGIIGKNGNSPEEKGKKRDWGREKDEGWEGTCLGYREASAGRGGALLPLLSLEGFI